MTPTPPYTRRKRPYVNKLIGFQVLMFILAVAFCIIPVITNHIDVENRLEAGYSISSVHPLGPGDFIMAYIFIAVWLISLLAGMMVKANWENSR